MDDSCQALFLRFLASNNQTTYSEAFLAADRWISVWRAATFGTDEYYRECITRDRYYVDKLLERFGAELVRLGRDFRTTQAGALAKASFIANWMARVALDSNTSVDGQHM